MSKWDAIAFATLILCVFGLVGLPDVIRSFSSSDVAISCNNLKVAAIAASQPEPICAR